MISADSDSQIRIWNLRDKQISSRIKIERPPANKFSILGEYQMDLINYAEKTPFHETDTKEPSFEEKRRLLDI